MSILNFILYPFCTASRSPLSFTGTIERERDAICIRLDLSVSPDTINIRNLITLAEPSSSPGRRHRLWETTCFELFLKTRGVPSYLEFNLSPANHWNVYRFDRYRFGMREETAIRDLPFVMATGTYVLSLSANISINNLFPKEETLQAGICAVIESGCGNKTYWALHHPGNAPDFHHPDSFIIKL